MQCLWASTTNVLRRQTWKACSAGTRTLAQNRKLSWTRWTQNAAAVNAVVDKSDFQSAANSFLSTAVRDTSTPPSSFAIQPSPRREVAEKDKPESQGPPSPAQLSRIAAQAVRIACQAPSTGEAFLIVKSLQRSAAFYGSPQNPGNVFPKNVPIDFGTEVSPRLATHALLHGLIRRGMTKKAGDIARRLLMHKDHLRLSGHTLRAISMALCRTDAAALQEEGFRSQAQKRKNRLGDYIWRPQEILESKTQLPCTRVAMQIFFAAKQYQKQRTKQMFEQLMDACLLQGEILIATFLFAFLVKQWQAGFLLTNRTLDESPSPLIEASTSGDPVQKLNPKSTYLRSLLSYISPIITGDILPNPHAIRPSHEEAVQSLAVLADMLYEGTLRHSQIDGLVKSLTLFHPSSSVLVWTLRKGKKHKWERKWAHEYFDTVLDDLLVQVTDSSYGKPKGRSTYWTSRETFNSLIYYSLQRKRSPAMAEMVIRHMKEIGGAYSPNITAYNIVLRLSSTLRRHDITDRVLQTLRERPENAGHAIMYRPPRKRTRSKVQKVAADSQEDELSPDATAQLIPIETSVSTTQKTLSNPFVPVEIMEGLSPAVQRIFLEAFNLELLASSELPLPADGITLAAYLDYLTSSGRPEAAIELVTILLPELKTGSYPSGVPIPPRLSRKKPWNRPNAVARAVHLGPLFFTAALNAAVKAGRTALAERTWRLAKAGEGCSWNGAYSVKPWILPCAAYTLMMKCYAQEARKAYRLTQDPSSAGPRRRRSGRVPIGWGTRSLLRRLQIGQGADLLEVSRDMGAYILRSRKISEEVYRVRLIQYLEAGGPILDRKTVQVPVADERFYNAALDLFGRVPGSYYPTKRKLSPRRLLRLQRRQLDIFMQRGSVGFPQASQLTSVLCSMRESGYEIPLLYRHMLVGINVPPECPRPNRIRGCRPASRVGIAGKTRLSTVKDRGLPVPKSLTLGRPIAS